MYRLILRQMMRNKLSKLKLILGIVILSYISGKNLSILENQDLSVIEFVLFTISDNYYFSYGIITIFFLILLDYVGLKNEIYYIRQKKFINYFINKNIANLILSGCFVLLYVAVTTIIGLSRFKMYNTFNYNLNILNIYKETFNTPLISLITMCTYMILGMFFITMITEFVNYLFNKNITALFLLIIYLSIWLGIRQADNYNNFYFIYLNNFLIFEFGINRLTNLISIEICTIFVITIFMSKRWWIIN